MLEAELQRILNLFEDFLEITLGARDLISGQFGVFIFIERLTRRTVRGTSLGNLQPFCCGVRIEAKSAIQYLPAEAKSGS